MYTVSASRQMYYIHMHCILYMYIFVLVLYKTVYCYAVKFKLVSEILLSTFNHENILD